MYRDRLAARARDLIRNDGWATAAVMRTVDNVIGPDFRPISKPDYRWLRTVTGIKAFDHRWADEFGQAVEANWRSWANDPFFYCDSERMLSFPQMMQLGFRHHLIDGDALSMLHWLPDRIAVGRARYATAVQIMDPDRLSNPQQNFDQQALRGGVEVDSYGVPTWYHIRRAHQGDWFSAGDSVRWDRIARETNWGRPIVVHSFDHDRASQHRGVGFLTPVIQRFKMLIKYDLRQPVLDPALGAAVYAGRTRREDWTRVAERSVGVVFLLVTAAIAALFVCFARHDYQLVYVASHAARSMPLHYRLAALWGGQAGSLLLWLWMLSAYSAAASGPVAHCRNSFIAPMTAGWPENVPTT